MVESCDKTFNNLRDKAILLEPLDTGSRADEFLKILMDDFNLAKVEILIRLGKSGKSRIDYLGKTSRRAAQANIKSHTDT